MFDKDDELQRDQDLVGQDDDNFEDVEPEYEDDADESEEDESDVEEQDSDSEPDSDAEHEAKGGKKTDQDKVEERIGELTRKRHEAERRAEQREKELRELQAQMLNGREPQVPELPDPDDVSPEEFQAAVRKRDEAIQSKIAWQQEKQQFESQTSSAQQQKLLERNQQIANAAQTYTERAKSLGIKQEQLQQAGAVLQQAGISDDVAMRILADDNGPLITTHLAKNYGDLLEVVQSDPIDAMLYIERNVRKKLQTERRKSKTPRPPKRTKGRAPDRKDKFPLTRNAKFE